MAVIPLSSMTSVKLWLLKTAFTSPGIPEWKKVEQVLKSRSRIRMNYEDFLGDPGEGFEQCYTLSPIEKEDRVDTIKELDKISSIR